jgi:hypothetical protein
MTKSSASAAPAAQHTFPARAGYPSMQLLPHLGPSSTPVAGMSVPAASASARACSALEAPNAGFGAPALLATSVAHGDLVTDHPTAPGHALGLATVSPAAPPAQAQARSPPPPPPAAAAADGISQSPSRSSAAGGAITCAPATPASSSQPSSSSQRSKDGRSFAAGEFLWYPAPLPCRGQLKPAAH